MSDLISREAALLTLKIFDYDIIPSVLARQYVTEMLDTLYVKLNEIPSAEPEERKTGKWIEEKINSYTSSTYCSECGSSAPFVYKSDDYYGNHAHGETAKTKFCPNCGADMRLQNT